MSARPREPARNGAGRLRDAEEDRVEMKHGPPQRHCVDVDEPGELLDE